MNISRKVVVSVVAVQVWAFEVVAASDPHRLISTFSIVAYDPAAQEWGVAVQSKFLAVGAVVPYAKAGVGAIASQAWGNTRYGDEGLVLLAMGIPAAKVVEILTAKDPDRDSRQLGVVDSAGAAAAFTGEKCQSWAGHIVGEGFCVQGNILTGNEVVEAMAENFRQSKGTLGSRLIDALEAGQRTGGDSRGMQSAALLVVRAAGGYSGYNDRLIDLRVDDHTTPIAELRRLHGLHQSIFQGPAYVRLAVQYLTQTKLQEAERAFAAAIAIAENHPDDAQLLNAVAWELAIHNQRLEQALTLAQRAVKAEPNDANIWDTLGEVYARLTQFEAAIEAEEKAIALSGGQQEFKVKAAKWREAAHNKEPEQEP